MEFQLGEIVRQGSRIGTVTDIGTMLVEFVTQEGVRRVVCPWELEPMRALHDQV